MFIHPSDHDREARIGHAAVVVTLHLQDLAVGVFDKLEHAPEVGDFFVASEEFFVSVGGEEEDGWAVISDVIEGGEVVYDGGCVLDSALGSDGVVGDRLAAEGDQAGELVGVDFVLGEPAFVEGDHAGEVAAGGMAADEDVLGRAAVFRDIVESPGCGCGGVFDIARGFVGGAEPIAGGDDGDALVHQILGDVAVAAGQPASVEPDHRAEILLADRIIDVELAPLADRRGLDGLGSVGNRLLGFVGLGLGEKEDGGDHVGSSLVGFSFERLGFGFLEAVLEHSVAWK